MQINQYTNTSTVIGENDYLDLDKYISAGVYQSNKILGSSVISQLGSNFANDNLTLTANRTHSGGSNRLTMNSFKDITFETPIAPTFGLASFNFNGYGTGSSDITHDFNSDAGTIHRMYGDTSQIAFGPLHFETTTQGINKNSSANAVRIFKAGAGDWNFGWNFAELRAFGTFASNSIEINNDNSESYFTQIESTTGRQWKFGHKGGDGSIAGKIGGGLVDTEIVKIDRTNGSFDLSLGLIKLIGVPTSSAGLPAGTLWNDSGTIKIA